MVTEALQFGWQVRDGCQRQRRSKEGYFGGRLQGPILMKAANIWFLDWINEFFSIAQKEAFFFLLAPKLLLKEKNHCQNGSLLVDYTLEEIRGKADIKKLNCNIGAECAVILFFGGDSESFQNLGWNFGETRDLLICSTTTVSRWIWHKTHPEEWTFWRRRLGSGKWRRCWRLPRDDLTPWPAMVTGQQRLQRVKVGFPKPWESSPNGGKNCHQKNAKWQLGGWAGGDMMQHWCNYFHLRLGSSIVS